MSRQIYRQAALDRLASPEQLDRPHTLVSARGWSALALLVAALFGGVVWALFSSAPVKVSARGIVLQQGGLREIVADAAGRIDQLMLKRGDIVHSKMAVANFQRSETLREIRDTQAELADAEARLARLTLFYEGQNSRETAAEKERLKGIGETRKLIERREKLLTQSMKDVENLLERKIVVKSKMINTELELANARERLARIADEENSLALRTLDRQSRQELALLDEQLKVDRLNRQLIRRKEQLAEERVVTSPHAGRVVEVKVNQGDMVSAGTAIATLEPIGGEDTEAIGVLFVTPADGKRIREGMAAEIVPSIFRREEYGFIRGEVVFVSSVPATAEGMQSVLRNEQLVKEMSGGSAPFEVRIRFIKDNSTPSGFAWSSSSGPNATVHPGTLLEAAILVDRLPIANLVVPGLDAVLGVRRDG
ncbi:MAG: NHLP bacteriocin system secretion protein [Rhodospirillales bacterium]|nr:NHLP bacteriocin system secretion protein [Rhodospirillales bacterium]